MSSIKIKTMLGLRAGVVADGSAMAADVQSIPASSRSRRRENPRKLLFGIEFVVMGRISVWLVPWRLVFVGVYLMMNRSSLIDCRAFLVDLHLESAPFC